MTADHSADAGAAHRGTNAPVQRLAGHIQQPLGFQVQLAAPKGAGIVAVEAAPGSACVDADNIAGPDHLLFRRDTVDHFVVDADARGARETVKAFEVGFCTLLHDIVINNLVNVGGSNTSLDRLAPEPEGGGADFTGSPHDLQLFGIFDLDHDAHASSAFSSSSLVSAMLS